MSFDISETETGDLTLPKPLRERAGLSGEVIGVITDEGLLLQPKQDPRIYSDEEVSQYKRDDEKLGRVMDELRIAKRNLSR